MILGVLLRTSPQSSVIGGAFDMYLHIFVSVSYKKSLPLAVKSFRRMHHRKNLTSNDNYYL